MKIRLWIALPFALLISCTGKPTETIEEPSGPMNILFIMSDDHARKAISAYDTTLIRTPNIDRLADEGILFNRAFVTNSICGPSRAVIMTGKYSHINGFKDNGDKFDGDQWTFPKELQKFGYQTAVIGKWHLNSQPQGFDYSNILVGQGEYYNPRLVLGADTMRHTGYTTSIITDKAMEWLESRDSLKPFMLMVHHKAPHRNWMPDTKDLHLFNEDLPLPENFFDDYESRSEAASEQDMRIENMWLGNDFKLKPEHYGKETGTGGKKGFESERGWLRILNSLTEDQRQAWDKYYDSIGEAFKANRPEGKELLIWKYQRYLKDYLRTVHSVDENIGRLLKYLEEKGLLENTLIVYTSDQGFYLGEHGWYDKRFMYEESFGTPLLMRVPGIEKPREIEELVMNLDITPTLLDYAGVPIPDNLQGLSLKPLVEGKSETWRSGVYYHYYEYPRGWHNVKKHYGIRTDRYKLIHYYHDIDKWELFDLKNDPMEMNNLIDHPEYLDMVDSLKTRLYALQETYNEEEAIKQMTLQQ